MSTFNNGTADFAPLLVTGFEASRASRTVIHSIIGTNAVAVALQPSDLRSGTLTTLWSSFGAAALFEAALGEATVWTFTDVDVPDVNMTFVVSGGITLALDEETRDLALVSVEFQEVTP